MPRAIDFHVHLPTTEFMQVTLGPYAAAAERFFRTEVKLKDIEQIAADYVELDMIGVLLAWDAETAPLSRILLARRLGDMAPRSSTPTGTSCGCGTNGARPSRAT